MTKQQRQHLAAILKRVNRRLPKKYKAGQKEHGGNLWEKPMAREICAEAIDMLVYADTLASQHAAIAMLCRLILKAPNEIEMRRLTVKILRLVGG